MPAIFFKLSPTQEHELTLFMKEEGYESKAEFFRFLLKFYKYQRSSAEIQLEHNIHRLGETMKQLKSKGKVCTPLEEQLHDV